jgi:hypothetical protein
LYLPRPPNEKRAVANADALLAAVRAELRPPYQLKVFQHGKRLVDDVTAFKEAKVVFGPHGGAWGNIGFVPPGGHVIEFLPMRKLWRRDAKANFRPCYLWLARACRLAYWMVEPVNFDFDRPKQMVVQTKEVLSALGYIGVLKVSQKPNKLVKRFGHLPLRRRQRQWAEQGNSSAPAPHVPKGYVQRALDM